MQQNRDINQNESPSSHVIAGRNAVAEALRSGREIDRLLVAHGASGGSLAPIIAKCKQRGILIKEVSPQKLDYLCGGIPHQGVALLAAAHAYCQVEDMLRLAEERGEPPFLILCDEIEDPHNLGAIIRTAEACGVHGVIVPKRRSASLNATVAKAASGALEYMKVARVTNLTAVIDQLKEQGIWVYGAHMEGQSWCGQGYTGPTALVIGSEGKGIGRLVAQHCDMLVSLPMFGHINSLNASVAAGVLMYEVARQRSGAKAVQPK